MTNADIMQHGETVLISSSLTNKDADELIDKVREMCGQSVGWRATKANEVEIKALGNLTKVRAAIKELMPQQEIIPESFHLI